MSVWSHEMICLVCGGDHQPSAIACTSEGMDREIARLGVTRWNALTAHASRAANHVLWRTGDAGAPEQIKDRNGEVALNCCKRCGNYESGLDGPCPLSSQDGATP